MAGAPISIAVMCLLTSSAVLSAPTETPVTATPVQLVLHSSVEGLDDSCPSVEGAESYSVCEGTTTITDGVKSSPAFTSETLNSVFVFNNDEEWALFTFDTPQVISKIEIHYYRNMDDQGFPKIRFFAVPDSFSITDADTMDKSSYPTKSLDAVLPGSGAQGLTSKTMEVTFTTKQLLMEKSESKNYKLFMSEIEFFAQESADVDLDTTTASKSPPSESSTTTTTSSKATTTEDSGDSGDDGGDGGDGDKEVTTTVKLPEVNVNIGALEGGAAITQYSVVCMLASLLAGLLCIAG